MSMESRLSADRSPLPRAARGALRRWACCTALPALALLAGCAPQDGKGPVSITVATVNNDDMVTLKSLSGEFERTHPDIRLKWVVLEENVLRQRVTTDVATRSSIFDVVTTSSYEVPIWSKAGWLRPLSFGPDYAVDDMIRPIRDALSYQGKLYAGAFYGESTMTYYRKDLFRKAGLTMPARPTWQFLYQAADRLKDPAKGIYGICLRGKAGWGENMAVLTAMSNAYGARLFDMQWRPQFNSPQWRKTIEDYVSVLRRDGPPGSASNGFNETLALTSAGKCAIWFDSTVAAASLMDAKTSQVAGDLGYAFAPSTGLSKSSNWLYIWAMGVPTASRKQAAANAFVTWATGPQYQQLLARTRGWDKVPPGTRESLYKRPEIARTPYARLVYDSILAADAQHPSVQPVPYSGVQYASIPEFQAIGTEAGQAYSAALNGGTSPARASATAQAAAERIMKEDRGPQQK
jgi:sorbitol/mannitol transport system substrate-binding protein